MKSVQIRKILVQNPDPKPLPSFTICSIFIVFEKISSIIQIDNFVPVCLQPNGPLPFALDEPELPASDRNLT